MHGCFSQPENHGLIVTEEDYINFLNNTMSTNAEKRPLVYALGRIAFSTILFIGYSLADWNFRVIYKATVESAEGNTGKSYAIQYRSDTDPSQPQASLGRTKWESLSDFWSRKNVEIINADASGFMDSRDLPSLMRP